MQISVEDARDSLDELVRQQRELDAALADAGSFNWNSTFEMPVFSELFKCTFFHSTDLLTDVTCAIKCFIEFE